MTICFCGQPTATYPDGSPSKTCLSPVCLITYLQGKKGMGCSGDGCKGKYSKRKQPNKYGYRLVCNKCEVPHRYFANQTYL